MKRLGFAVGMAAGAAAATAAVTGMYPSVGKKLKRDGKKLVKAVTGMI